ncbi:hypothetical protein TRVL_09396 [Trypanosoma vivax]|nr:hypothetical protein TRVL_09396 [Trypanosoma vivax]
MYSFDLAKVCVSKFCNSSSSNVTESRSCSPMLDFLFHCGVPYVLLLYLFIYLCGCCVNAVAFLIKRSCALCAMILYFPIMLWMKCARCLGLADPEEPDASRSRHNVPGGMETTTRISMDFNANGY